MAWLMARLHCCLNGPNGPWREKEREREREREREKEEYLLLSFSSECGKAKAGLGRPLTMNNGPFSPHTKAPKSFSSLFFTCSIPRSTEFTRIFARMRLWKIFLLRRLNVKSSKSVSWNTFLIRKCKALVEILAANFSRSFHSILFTCQMCIPRSFSSSNAVNKQTCQEDFNTFGCSNQLQTSRPTNIAFEPLQFLHLLPQLSNTNSAQCPEFCSWNERNFFLAAQRWKIRS